VLIDTFRHCKKHWPLILFFIILFPLLLTLGQWQLSRAEEKQRILSEYTHLNSISAIDIESLDGEEALTYRRIKLRGVYDVDRYWLLDNRSRNGRAGYEVLMSFGDQNLSVLVNRGWLPAGNDRSKLPAIETPGDQQVVSGYLVDMESNAWIKHSKSDLTLSWPKRVLHLDPHQASQHLGEPLYPWILRLDDDAPGALLTNWQIVSSNPQRHYAYAVQWFSMALALLALFIWAIRKAN
jgi:surfeit locus 1 family protein